MPPLNESLGYVDVAGVRVASLTHDDLIERVAAAAAAGGPPQLISYANAWCVCLAQDNPEYRQILNVTASLIYADGQAVVWASGWLGRRLPERVNLGDFWPELLRRLSARNASVYLLGGEAGLAQSAAESLRRAIPKLKIVGARDGYFTDAESDSVAQAIRAAAPAVVFVGLSAPRQEIWAARHLAEIGAPVVWCVGALFEYYGGKRSRAPVWMRRCGLEWLYRLALEPRRLWRRYLIGNLRFIALIFRQVLRRPGNT